jgi:hypothetical protein
VAKYTSSGAYQWAAAIGSTTNVVGNGIAVRGNDDVYAVGETSGLADVDPGSGTTNVNGGYLVRYVPFAIATTTPSARAFCAGATVSVPFSITGTFNTGNVFTAQLSSAAGNFDTPTAILPLTTAAGIAFGLSAVTPPLRAAITAPT